ncbi:PucR family transcriptional regulator [Streptomyces sp. NPDC056716]|uniref:PucR family transcriptional regulator n=1 Tax=unclassified Streptomyces TaxID=2593676 RepID=UPI0036755BEF
MRNAQHSGLQVTVGQLLALGMASGYDVIGGDKAMLRRVDSVVPGTTVRAISTLPPGALVVFDRSQLAAGDVAIELAISTGFRTGIAGIVAERPQRRIPAATQHLAEKFDLPVVLLDRVDVGSVVAELEPHVRAPALVGAKLLHDAVTALSSAAVPRDTGELLRRLASVTRCPVGLVDTDGHLIAGTLEPLSPGFVSGLARLAASPGHAPCTLHDGDELLLVHAATVAGGSAPNLWLVARPPPAGSVHVRNAQIRILAVAALAYTAYLSERSLKFERESRQRTLLLTEILENPETPRRQTVEQATALGWRLSGWHTAVHIAGRRAQATPSPGGTAALLEQALRAQGLTASLVERPAGWAFWTTVDTEPHPHEAAALARSVRRALLSVERDDPQLRPCAGIGGAHPGTGGLGCSLQEAEQAGLLARTQDIDAPVEHVGTASVKRLLVAWYSTGPLGEIVDALLDPVRSADPNGELLQTLRAYLDNESSTTAAAAVLGVHRNTVLNRLEKVSRLLTVDLSQPDQRLAVRLAVHAATETG